MVKGMIPESDVKNFEEAYEQIKKEPLPDGLIASYLLKDMIEKKFKLKVSKSSVHNIMKSVGFSYITPRKSHYKQDKIAAENFKKKSSK